MWGPFFKETSSLTINDHEKSSVSHAQWSTPGNTRVSVFSALLMRFTFVCDGTQGAFGIGPDANDCPKIHDGLRVKVNVRCGSIGFRPRPELLLSFGGPSFSADRIETRQHTPNIAI